MTGKGCSHGSITVVNAMPCGIGATIGVGLNTEAVFSELGDEKIVRINNDVSENTEMARICVRKAFEAADLEEPSGWILHTDSEIPVSRGLKSSSCACNAIIRAVFDDIGYQMDQIDLIRLGVSCAREAKVTVTGSFDDACGCGIGGLVMTDNRKDIIIDRADIETLDVIIHVPEYKIRKTGLPLDRLHDAAPMIEPLLDIVMTDPLKVMTINGEIISKISDVDNSIAEDAIRCGALGAGMSGSGPAIAIVVPEGDGRSFADDMGLNGSDTIITKTRCGQ